MRGAGFVCDECEAKVVDAAAHLANLGGTVIPYLPAGWLIVGLAAPTAVCAGEHHFCSWHCAAGFAAAQADSENEADK